jgi:hypothetical protein
MTELPTISLLVQVYNGGTYFQECLESIGSYISFFHKVYISINYSKEFDNDYKRAVSFKEKNLTNNIYISTRQKTYTALQHGFLFYKEILKSDKSSDFFLLLCHDDIISPNFGSHFQKLISTLNDDEVINPARSFYQDSFTSDNLIGTYYGLLSYSDYVTTKEDFANKCFDNSPRTSISGLIFPKKVLKEFSSLMPFCNFGYRAEFFIMCNYTTKYVKGTDFPLVYIREHAGQEGSYCNKDYLRMDEFFYRYYLWYTTNNVLLTKRLVYNIKSFLELVYFIKLNFFMFLKTRKISKLFSPYFIYKALRKGTKHLLIKLRLYRGKK